MTTKKKKATRRKLTRQELALELDLRGGSIDRLIAAGLEPCGMRGRAKLYRLADAKRIQRAIAKSPTKYGESLLTLLRAQREETIDRISELVSGKAPRDEVIGAWSRYARLVMREMRTWPKRIAGEFGKVERGTSDTETHAVLRPLLEALTTSPAPASKKPRRMTFEKAADDLPAAKRQLLEARAVHVELRTRARRERWIPLEAAAHAYVDAITRVRQTWWSGLPSRVTMKGPQSRETWLEAARECLEEASAALETKRLELRT